ncbi:MAG: hypothetical protein OXC95_15445 [Dehalococcoidia bacterium]|nr:hypothetical protein [Dehalococcoidia bacterium]
MNVRMTGGARDLSPELIAAMTASVQAFFEQEAVQSFKRHSGISAWRRVAHTGFDSGWRGWRMHD